MSLACYCSALCILLLASAPGTVADDNLRVQTTNMATAARNIPEETSANLRALLMYHIDDYVGVQQTWKRVRDCRLRPCGSCTGNQIRTSLSLYHAFE